MSEVNPRVHADAFGPMSRGPHHWRDDGTCSYCGSMSVGEALRLLKMPGTQFSGADQKYGYPHKFYIHTPNYTNAHERGAGGGKFYSRHLYDATPEELAEFQRLSLVLFGIAWSLDDKGLGFRCPRGGFYGWQTSGRIGEDGAPVFTEGSPTPPPPEWFNPPSEPTAEATS